MRSRATLPLHRLPVDRRRLRRHRPKSRRTLPARPAAPACRTRSPKASSPAGRATPWTWPSRGLLHLKVLRSPHAHARILAIGRDKAMAVPGVVAIFTWEDVPRRLYSTAPPRGPPRRPRRHLHPRQRRAFRRPADRGRRRRERGRRRGCLPPARRHYEILPAVFDPVAAMEPGAPVLHRQGRRGKGQHLCRHPRRGRQRGGRLHGGRRRPRDDLLHLARSARPSRNAWLDRLARRRRTAACPHQLAGAVHRPAEALPSLRPARPRPACVHRAGGRRLRRQAGDGLRRSVRARHAARPAGR